MLFVMKGMFFLHYPVKVDTFYDHANKKNYLEKECREHIFQKDI